MKKVTTALMALVLALAISGTVQAGSNMGGMNGDCGICDRSVGDGPEVKASTDMFRKFQADTIDMRQEMMMKRFELQRENLKGTPDAAKVATLKDEIKAIQTKINDIRVVSGLPERGKRDGECGPKAAKGGCDKRQMGGYNGAPCGSR